MNTNNSKTYTYIAVDISKDTLQVQTPKEGFSVANKTEGFAVLCNRISCYKDALIACEASGGYERALLAYMNEHHIPCCLINPTRVRGFAKSEGIKAKSDPIDAKLIYKFAVEKHIQPMIPASPEQQELAAWLDRRSHLTEQLAREKNRIQNSPPILAKSIKKMISLVEKEIERVDQTIRKLIDKNQKMKTQANEIISIVGIGEVTTWTILAYLGEIGRVNRNQAVALAGLAPFDDDSGLTHRKRCIQGGRAKLRRCLYMAAQSAARHNPVIQPYVARLIERGKPYKWAMVAAMRKLIVYIHSLLKNIPQFSENPA